MLQQQNLIPTLVQHVLIFKNIHLTSTSPVPFIFQTASPGWEVQENPNCSNRAKSQQPLQPLIRGQLWGVFVQNTTLRELQDEIYILNPLALIRGLKKKAVLDIGSAYAKGKVEHREAACPSLAAHPPFLAARSSKEVIRKHLFAKSQPINPRETTPSLPHTAVSMGGGEMKESCRSDQQAGAWQESFIPKIFGKSSSL